jgi:aldose 1-epimerase
VDELRFAHGPIEVVVLPQVGARLHQIRVDGHDLLRTPADLDLHRSDPFFWGGYVMAPWGGRIEAAPTVVAGRLIDLSPNFVDGTAIHGQVYDRPWRLDDDGWLRCDGGGDGWPWPYSVAMRVTVSEPSVGVHLRLVNRADGPMPAGLGLHPWFRRPLEVRLDAADVIVSNTDPASLPEPVHGAHDLRTLTAIPDGLDATWATLGDPPVTLRWPATGIEATMRIGAPASFVVAASPGHLDAVAIEPQTHAAQAIRRLLRGEPGALALLEPGGTLELRMDLAFRR